jgi:hypothetical protein
MPPITPEDILDGLLAKTPDMVMPAALAAGRIQADYSAAVAARRADTRPPQEIGDAHGCILMGETWLVRVVGFADLLRGVALDDAYRPAAQIAADLFAKTFPGVATKPILNVVMADDEKILANGPYGMVDLRIDRAAADALKGAAQAFLDALPKDLRPG